MLQEIKRYPVKNPLLKEYIKFYWELKSEHMSVDHNIIPQRNINLRINLSGTSQYIITGNVEQKLEPAFFSGLQDHCINARMKSEGKTHMIGICFYPDGFYPFLRMPVSEIKNCIISAGDAGKNFYNHLSERLANIDGAADRLDLLEKELLNFIANKDTRVDPFRKVFSSLRQENNPSLISAFCKKNNLCPRRMERMFNKYVGLTANTFLSLNRFQESLNKILRGDYSKLSDVAYEYGYYDQMHFIRDFKRFAGNTPKEFLIKNNSMLNIGRLK